MVVIPNVEEEDLRRSHRERDQFHHQTEGQPKRVRCIMIVALARKLAIALWRYLETGLIPQGAVVK